MAERCGSSPLKTSAPWIPRARLRRRVEELLYATCAQLVNYPDKAGPAGSQLTAEVAQSLPTRSADGRTYTFKIRPGFRFSPPSNQPVTAQTFKDSIERTLNPRMDSLLGAVPGRCRRRSRVHGRKGQPHRRRDRQRRHAYDPPARAGAGLSLPDRAAGVLRGPVQHPDQRGARRDPVRRAVLRGVLHARPGGRAGTQPQLPRQPSTPLRADRARGRDPRPARVRRDRGRHRRLHGSGLVFLDHDRRARRATRRPLRARQRRGRARTPAVLRQPGGSNSTTST